MIPLVEIDVHTDLSVICQWRDVTHKTRHLCLSRVLFSSSLHPVAGRGAAVGGSGDRKQCLHKGLQLGNVGCCSNYWEHHPPLGCEGQLHMQNTCGGRSRSGPSGVVWYECAC